MSGRRVGRRIAPVAKPKKCRCIEVNTPTLVTKVFDWLSQSLPFPGVEAGGRRQGSRGGDITGVAVWRGRGGERRIVLRGALPETPFSISPFVTNEWHCEVGL
jgi:hypothetical protein